LPASSAEKSQNVAQAFGFAPFLFAVALRISWTGVAWALNLASCGEDECGVTMFVLIRVVILVSSLSVMNSIAHASSSTADSGNPEVLSFRAWKLSRVEQAQSALDRAALEALKEQSRRTRVDRQRAQLQSLKADQEPVSVSRPLPKGTPTRVQRRGAAESPLAQAQLNLALANELTLNDYFVLYLSQLRDPGLILTAAKKMAPEEVAELMIAYKRQLDGGRIGLMQGPPEPAPAL